MLSAFLFDRNSRGEPASTSPGNVPMKAGRAGVNAAARFDDGAAYERMMGVWSRLAGSVFLDWAMPEAGLRWVDVGCGSGAFTELLTERCAPTEIQGIDSSEAQIAFARTRPTARTAAFGVGDARALPFPADRFDAAVMALVIFFVPDPAKGVAEMARVVRPGGVVAAYAWDVMNGGSPLDPIRAEMQALGLASPNPPASAASEAEALRDLWTGAGLENVETRKIAVQRTFSGFDEFWQTTVTGSIFAERVNELERRELELLRIQVRQRLPADAAGRITYGAHANAVKGQVSHRGVD